MPSQKQLHWSQLRVGITVIAAAIALMVVIFLMSSSTGLFVHKLHLRTYFDNAEGLRPGAPVRLQGVDIGNVTEIRVVASQTNKPVQVTMRVNRASSLLRKDSVAMLSTAGVLGETFVDIDGSHATGPRVEDNDVLLSQNRPDIQDVIRSSQDSLKNMDVLLTRLNNVVSTIEKGQGSVGKFIYDPALYNKLNATLNQVQNLVNQVSNGQGTIGKLLVKDDLYNKLNASVDKLNNIVDQINAGQGTVGKLIKDPTLYNNANQTMAKANSLMTSIQQGKGAAGKLVSDEEFARKLQGTVSNLNELTTKMNQGTGTVGKLFNDPSVYDNSDKLMLEARQLMQAIRENPKKYLTIHFKIF